MLRVPCSRIFGYLFKKIKTKKPYKLPGAVHSLNKYNVCLRNNNFADILVPRSTHNTFPNVGSFLTESNIQANRY